MCDAGLIFAWQVRTYQSSQYSWDSLTWHTSHYLISTLCIQGSRSNECILISLFVKPLHFQILFGLPIRHTSWLILSWSAVLWHHMGMRHWMAFLWGSDIWRRCFKKGVWKRALMPCKALAKEEQAEGSAYPSRWHDLMEQTSAGLWAFLQHFRATIAQFECPAEIFWKMGQFSFCGPWDSQYRL